MPYRNFVFATIGLLTLPAALHAADTKEKSAVSSVKCRVFALNQSPESEVYIKTGGKYQRILISKDYVSPSFRTDAKDGIVFYRKVVVSDPKAAGTKEKESFEPCFSCAPDGSASRQLVFIMPNGKNSWSAVAKSDVDTAFPSGARLVFNLSAVPVAFNFGGTKLLVNPKQSALLNEAKSAPEGVAPVQLVRKAPSGEWVPFLNSVWRQTPDERAILLIYPVAGTEHVSLTCIPDRIEPKDAEENSPPGSNPAQAGRTR